MLKFEDLPNWLINLEVEELTFIKRFVCESGSLKNLAIIYDNTYPTIRLRLDRLIEKINQFDKSDNDSFIEKVRLLALDDKMDLDTARVLINEYKKMRSKK